MPREEYIEASRTQAISFDQDNNAVWTNNVKDLEINVGDEISVLASMISTNGGGGSEEFIQIIDTEENGVKRTKWRWSSNSTSRPTAKAWCLCRTMR